MHTRLNSVSWQMIFLLGLLVCGMVPVSATEITLSPDQVAQGDRITIDIKDLPNSSTFTLQIESAFRVTPGTDFSFRTSDFFMPLSLTNGELSASTENTQTTTLVINKGSTQMSVGRRSDANGIFTITETQNIPGGKFDFIGIEGTALPDKDTIVSKLQMSGKKNGPDSSRISFVVTGIENGVIYITALVDDSPVLVKKVTVGNGLAATADVASDRVFYSVDRKVSLKSRTLDHAELIAVQKNAVPATWLQINKTYMILSGSPALSGSILSFTVPSLPGTDYAYFIGCYDGIRWSPVPSRASGDKMVSAPVEKAGTCGLMAYSPENTAGPAKVPATDNTQVSVQKSLRIASIAQSSSPVKENPADAGILPVCGALIGAVLLAGLLRTRE